MAERIGRRKIRNYRQAWKGKRKEGERRKSNKEEK